MPKLPLGQMARIPQWLMDRSAERSVSALVMVTTTAIGGSQTSKLEIVVLFMCITLKVW